MRAQDSVMVLNLMETAISSGGEYWLLSHAGFVCGPSVPYLSFTVTLKQFSDPASVFAV